MIGRERLNSNDTEMVLFDGTNAGLTHSITFDASFRTPGDVRLVPLNAHTNRTLVLLPHARTLYAMEIVVSRDHCEYALLASVSNTEGVNAHFRWDKTEQDGCVVEIVRMLQIGIGDVFHSFLECCQVLRRKVVTGKRRIPIHDNEAQTEPGKRITASYGTAVCEVSVIEGTDANEPSRVRRFRKWDCDLR